VESDVRFLFFKISLFSTMKKRLWGGGQSELGNSAWGSSSVVQVSDDGTLDLGDEMETVSQMGGLRDILER
jgi:hypothetical protein